MEQVDVQH